MQQFEEYHPKPDWHSIMLFGIGCLSGYTSPISPKNTSHRIFFGFFLCGSLIFNVCFYSTMINILNKPFYENQIDSIQQIIDSSYELTGDDFALEHLKKQNEVT